MRKKILEAIEHSDITLDKFCSDFYPGKDIVTSKKNFKKRLATSKFSQKELKIMADILKCGYVSILYYCGAEFKDANDYYTHKHRGVYYSLQDRIKIICNIQHLKQSELCNKLNITVNMLSSRLKTDKLSLLELQQIAAALGGTYECYFIFDDGTKF